jgi:membrane protein
MPGRPSVWGLGGLTVRQLAARVWAAADADEVLNRAAALSYSFLFSVFPLLLFIAALLNLVEVHHVIRQLMDNAAKVLPGEAATLVRGTLRQIMAGNAPRGLISIGALTALWASSTAMSTLMSNLSGVYHVRDERRWWTGKAIAVGLTVVFATLVITATLITMLSDRIIVGLGLRSSALTTVVPVLLVLITVDLLYYAAPAGRRRWYWLTPGSLTCTVLWLAMSFGLRVYVGNFGHYDVMYGAIGGVIVFLLWLFLSSLALLIGAEVNRAIGDAARVVTPAQRLPAVQRVA